MNDYQPVEQADISTHHAATAISIEYVRLLQSNISLLKYKYMHDLTTKLTQVKISLSVCPMCHNQEDWDNLFDQVTPHTPRQN